MRKAVLDIETNRAWDTIWCAVLLDLESREPTVFTTPEELRYVLINGSYTHLIGHNLIGFDVPRLCEVWELDLRDYAQVVDTLVMGRLLFPSTKKGHSLREWGRRAKLEQQKDEFSDFDGGLTDEMVEYCIQDCRTNADLYEWLDDKLNHYRFSNESVELEHDVAWIIAEQMRNGFEFDEVGAMRLYSELTDRLESIETELQAVFPPIVHERWSEKTGKRLKDKVEVFNPGSRPQVAARLEGLGAKWSEETPKGKPKVSETTLAENNHIPEAVLVLEYMTKQKTLGLVKGWLHAVDDGRIYGRVVSNGAVTGRMTHSSPNLAQVPSDGACRELFTVREGYKLVGCDASGLELRMLAHYMQDEEYTEEILNGDIHTKNQQAAGLSTRPQAKTFIYAFLYGAGDAKIGSIVGAGANKGRQLKDRFLQQVPALSKLIDRLGKIATKSATKDYNNEAISSLPALDGRRLWVRHDHARLNTLLQGGGAVVMKQALVIAYNKLLHSGYDFKFVANVHDEWQLEVLEDHADAVGQILVDALRETGETLRCPLDAKYHVGDNWSETH